MELYQLRTFIMVAAEGNLTRASKKLYTSQPAVSAQIKALEDELGVSLFIRTPRGMVLTGDGSRLRQHAEHVLADIEEMVSEAREMRGVLQGEIKIGINTAPETLRIAELFTAMRLQHPDLRIHLLQTMTGEVLNKLEDGELDAGFIYGENSSQKIFTTELQQLELVVAGSAELQDDLTAAEPSGLEQFPWITTPEDCPFHNVASVFFKKHRIEPRQVALVDDESIIRAMVKNGAGISLMLKRDVLTSPDRKSYAIWDKEELNLKLSICCLKRRQDERMLQTLFSILSRIWDPAAVAEAGL